MGGARKGGWGLVFFFVCDAASPSLHCSRPFFFSLSAQPSTQPSAQPSVQPSVRPSHAQQPEEEEDGHKQEEGVLPGVIAVVEVAVSLLLAGVLVCRRRGWGGWGGASGAGGRGEGEALWHL